MEDTLHKRDANNIQYFSLTKINVTKWTTPNLSSKPVLVPHSQLHDCELSLPTETHVLNYTTPLHTKFLCGNLSSSSKVKWQDESQYNRTGEQFASFCLGGWVKELVCCVHNRRTESATCSCEHDQQQLSGFHRYMTRAGRAGGGGPLRSTKAGREEEWNPDKHKLHGSALVERLPIETADYGLWFWLENRGTFKDLSCLAVGRGAERRVVPGLVRLTGGGFRQNTLTKNPTGFKRNLFTPLGTWLFCTTRNCSIICFQCILLSLKNNKQSNEFRSYL